MVCVNSQLLIISYYKKPIENTISIKSWLIFSLFHKILKQCYICITFLKLLHSVCSKYELWSTQLIGGFGRLLIITFSICSSFIHVILVIYVLCSRERNMSRLKRQSICWCVQFFRAGKYRGNTISTHTVQKQTVDTGGVCSIEWLQM